MRGIRVFPVTASAFCLGLLCALAADAAVLPADIVVYGEQPPTFRDGTTPFPASGDTWEYRRESDDPWTRIKFRHVPGIRNQLGAFQFRSGTYGKYVFVGNAQTTGLGGEPTNLSMGIFDSETKQYCTLTLDPDIPAANYNIVTANPTSSKSRIIVAPGTHASSEGAIGYVLADLSTPACSWAFVGASAADLNLGWPAGQQLCPGGLCQFDSIAFLAHQEVTGDPYGRDYIAVGNYFGGHNAVIRIDNTGIEVVAFYQVPLFPAPGPGGSCYAAGAARYASADTRMLAENEAADGLRFVFSYDSPRQDAYGPGPVPEYCAQPFPFCPFDDDTRPEFDELDLTGAPCPGTGSCANGYCPGAYAFGGGLACDDNTDCLFPLEGGGALDLGPCSHGCIPKAESLICQTSNGGGSHHDCMVAHQGDHCLAGETCTPGTAVKFGPGQAYRFDASTSSITPTSPMFVSTNNTGTFQGSGITPLNLAFDSAHGMWAGANGLPAIYRTKGATEPCTVDGQTVFVPAGEHCYHDPSDPTGLSVVAPDSILSFERTPEIPYAMTTAQIGSRMYIVDTAAMQYAQAAFGAWFLTPATSYKIGFAFANGYIPSSHALAATSLPVQFRRCEDSLRGCNTNADCDAGEACELLPENQTPTIFSTAKYVQAGVASLWVASGYVQNGTIGQTDMYLLRVPAAVEPPDNLSNVRPSVAWDGSRLWLVAEHGGQLKYRVRQAGQWSGWHSIAASGPDPVVTVGGAAVIGTGTSVRIYARNSSGRVFQKTLQAPLNCAAGSCQWSTWVGLSNAVVTNEDPAAAFVGGFAYVAVRSTNENVYVINASLGGSWFPIDPAMLFQKAPSLTYHSDGKLWVVARQKVGGAIMSSRVDPFMQTWEAWAQVPTTGAPAGWNHSPAVVSDGSAVRVFGVESASPYYVWQTAKDASGWGAWRKPPTGSWSTVQPSATNINGDVDLVTAWLQAIQETSLP
jgi:hypothetical protein